MGNFFRLLIKFFNFSKEKRTNTLCGSIVFFVILSIVPAIYLLGKFIFLIVGIDFFSDIVFLPNEFKEILDFLKQATLNYGVKGNTFAILLAIYSASSIIYHFKRSGEVIYDYKPKNTLLLKIATSFLMLIALIVFSVFMGVYYFVSKLLTYVLGNVLGKILSGLILFIFEFFIIILVNMYSSPYKLKIKEVIKGSIFTCIFLLIASNIFFIYINYFSNYNQIYGKISIIIIFLLWVYLVVQGIIIGITINAFLIGRINKRKLKQI